MTPALRSLHQASRKIFDAAVQAVDCQQAVKDAIRLDGSVLSIADTCWDLSCRSLFVVAIGKAGAAMAHTISQVVGSKVAGGVISAASFADNQLFPSDRPSVFSGGHPLPNRASLDAAQASFDLLKRANEERALVIFLISGGGSAMIEWPSVEGITLADLRDANRQLVSCGASIAEINSVRRTFSAVKGGKLAALAPRADQVTLIISDTNRGDEANVASGPTMEPPVDSPDPRQVADRYGLRSSLPASILAAIEQLETEIPLPGTTAQRRHYVLLDNQTAVEAASTKARELGFEVQVAHNINEQAVDVGCKLLVSRLDALQEQSGGKSVCLISGGEFSCRVMGNGLGGRNLETGLRCAMSFDLRRRRGDLRDSHLVALSAGTDGLDGNSPAAGAISDETTVTRGMALGLDAEKSLVNSDSYTFFNALDDAIVTGPTGTNVRDLRVLLATAS